MVVFRITYNLGASRLPRRIVEAIFQDIAIVSINSNTYNDCDTDEYVLDAPASLSINPLLAALMSHIEVHDVLVLRVNYKTPIESSKAVFDSLHHFF